MKLQLIIAVLALTVLSSCAGVRTPATTNIPRYFTFELSDNVTRTEVSYKNRYGITISADLYMAKNIDTNQLHPAIVVGPPYGGVKEQGPGIYANQLAQRGFVVLAFDPSFVGDSGGDPRYVASPDIFAEDFSAGVDYLGTRSFVDRTKIGAIGICGSGGFAISAAQVDTRIKAVATSAMYDISRLELLSLGTGQQRKQILDQLGDQRWTDFENGTPEYNSFFPAEPADTIPAGMDEIGAEFFSYYGLKRGHHPHARGGKTTTSRLAWMNFQSLSQITSISPRPILFIAGDIAHSRSFSEIAYAAAAQPKELYIASNNTMHIDLYDDINKIPFAKLESFFNEAFNN
ncbi:MAG: alpha/beta hydrolase [Brevinema sp.]